MRGLFATAPPEPSLFGTPPVTRPKRSPPVGASAAKAGATPKAGTTPLQPPPKRAKVAQSHVPDVLQSLPEHPERIAEALELSASFHVLDIHMLDAWLWTGHVEYPPEAMTIQLAELVTRVQADASDSEAANALGQHQKAILKGLIPWEQACSIYMKTYMMCVTARKEVTKEEIVQLLDLLPPVVRLLSGLPGTKKYQKQKAHGWQDHVAKILTVTHLALEAHQEVVGTADEVADTAMEAEELSEGDEEELVDLSSLAAFVNP